MQITRQEIIDKIIELIKLKEQAMKQRRDCNEFKRLSHEANVVFFDLIDKITILTENQGNKE